MKTEKQQRIESYLNRFEEILKAIESENFEISIQKVFHGKDKNTDGLINLVKLRSEIREAIIQEANS